MIGLHCFIILLLQEWKKKRNTLYSVEIKNYCYNLNRTGKQSLQMQGVVCLLCISISWLLDTIVLHFKKICHLLFHLLCSSISLLLNTIVFHFKRTAIFFLWHGIKQTSCFFFSFSEITKSLKLPFQLHIHPSVPVKNRNGNTIRSWLPTELLSNRRRNCHCHLSWGRWNLALVLHYSHLHSHLCHTVASYTLHHFQTTAKIHRHSLVTVITLS